ncbi:MAG: RNA methyltransferase [Flavobacteriales bacterium]|nr:RNA methyltransferase [Flavobacteriales bacterium]|tara:strand:- start:26573 stop:27721 length:1149 start_codon:yes stop_codon:yes gene_type:complete
MEIVAKTFAGLEELLAVEIKEAGGKNLQSIKRGVKFEGDEEVLYRCLFSLRTVLRLLIPVFKFKAHTEKDLYFKVKKLPWEDFLDVNQTFAIDCIAHSKVFNHSKFVSLRVKDAICDRFRANSDDQRPSVNVKNPDLPINVHINNLDVIVSLDAGGFSLHQRGYRTKDHVAPLNEALAAGMLLLSDWDKKTDLYDPMCGSGTLLVEAAMMAQNLAPRLFSGKQFAIQKWDNFDSMLWAKVKKSLKSQIEPTSVKIHGTDISVKSVQMAKFSVKTAAVDDIVSVEQSDFFLKKNSSTQGFIISNPPYGERLQEENIIQFYREIGNTFKREYAGFQAWILSSNLKALKFIGLKPSKKIFLKNGPLDCKFQKYEMYAGSKKVIKN